MASHSSLWWIEGYRMAWFPFVRHLWTMIKLTLCFLSIHTLKTTIQITSKTHKPLNYMYIYTICGSLKTVTHTSYSPSEQEVLWHSLQCWHRAHDFKDESRLGWGLAFEEEEAAMVECMQCGMERNISCYRPRQRASWIRNQRNLEIVWW